MFEKENLQAVIPVDSEHFDMRMPTNYVDMTASDLEFGGAWSWKKFWTGVMIVGLSVAVATGIGAALAVGLTATVLGCIAGTSAVIGIGGLCGSMATSPSEFSSSE